MKLYFDFVNFDERTALMRRGSIPSATLINGWHLNEWIGKGREPDRPDLSLVYANDLKWQEASKTSNLALGKWIVLVGANSPKIGLPIMDTFFKWVEIIKFIDLKLPYQDASQPDSYPGSFAMTMPGP